MKTALRIATLLVIAAFVSPSQAQVAEPGGDAAATHLAITNPDEYAWQIFFYVSRPALAGQAGVADDTKVFGESPELPVVWETWALESGGDLSEVYLPNGHRPAPWPALTRGSRQMILEENLKRKAVLASSNRLAPRFNANEPTSQEVRINKAGFEFIVEQEMYSIDGLERLLARARNDDVRNLIVFPQGAKEIKAQWYPIRETDKPRYFWRNVRFGTQDVPFGLVALHIITKDTPNWVWMDFGHVDCEVGAGACDNAWLSQIFQNFGGQEPALTAPVDTTTRGPNPVSGQDGIRNETKGTVWENYILRGAQVDFVTAFGSPIVLSNPVIENGFQQSSCITCHARASIGTPFRAPDGTLSDRANTLSTGDPELGAPNETLFGAGPGLAAQLVQYLQTDFIWSAPFRAKRETP